MKGVQVLPEPDAVLDASQAGQVFGVSKSTVLRWAASGRIGHSIVGRKTLFTGADLREFLEAQRRSPKTLRQRVTRATSAI